MRVRIVAAVRMLLDSLLNPYEYLQELIEIDLAAAVLIEVRNDLLELLLLHLLPDGPEHRTQLPEINRATFVFIELVKQLPESINVIFRHQRMPLQA